jgi:hypothetical protein
LDFFGTVVEKLSTVPMDSPPIEPALSPRGSAGVDLVEKLAHGEIQCGSDQDAKEEQEVEEAKEVKVIKKEEE